MTININGIESTTEDFWVEYNGRKQVLNGEAPSAFFEDAASDIQALRITQQKSDNPYQKEWKELKTKEKVIFIFTLPFLGVLCLLSAFRSAGALERKIVPWLLSMEATLKINEKKTIELNYHASFYDRKTKLWTKPNITSDVISQKSITISPNFDGFLMAYNEYKWSVLSVFSIVFLFWGILAVIALLRNAISSAISFVILLCVTIVFCIVILRLMKKKAEAMRENFAAQIHSVGF